jgi:hypothetical protein
VIDILRALSLSALGTVAFAAILLLPGARLADRLVGSRGGVSARLAASVVLSQLLIAGVGLALIAIGRFSGVAVAVAAIAFSVISLPTAVGWLRAGIRDGRKRRLAVAPIWFVLLVTPWIGAVGLPGWPPADTLQWYYDGLGAQLTAAGGIPTGIAEWGTTVRWLPDYLVFNVDSEAYLALLSFLPRADALAAFRVPTALVALVLVFVALRLWVGRSVAIAGTTAIAGSVFFLAKFDAYKPEAVGILVGLAAGWLIVRGIRCGRPLWVLAGGAAFGVALSIHVIAAVVVGLIVAAFALVEWLALRRERTVRLVWLVRAALLGLLISVAMGVAVQGRATVAPAAGNPTIVAGEDPTWTFFLRSTGNFVEPAPPPPARPLAGGVTTPWAGLRITSAFGWWFLAVAAIGAAFGFALGGRRLKTATIGMLVAGSFMGLAIAFFAIRFQTYVPRWTGLVRFGQYAPLGAGILFAVATAGYVRLWSWLAERRLPRGTPFVIAVVALVWLLPAATARYRAEARIPESGVEALGALRGLAGPSDVVLTNALTTGTVESFTGVEDPLEGRQPLIEDPAFLTGANQLLLDVHTWFDRPTDRTLIDRLGASWVLVVDHPDLLGADALVGGSVAAVRGAPGLEPAWSADGILLLRVVDPVVDRAAHDSTTPTVDLWRAAVTAIVASLMAALLLAPRQAIGRVVPGRRRRA